jgi:hypothetical protein
MTADAPRNESRAATEHCHRPERMSPACRRVNMIMMIGPDGPSWTWIATVLRSVPNRVPRANLLMKGSGAGEPYRRMRVMRLERGWPAEREGVPRRLARTISSTTSSAVPSAIGSAGRSTYSRLNHVARYRAST